MPTLSTTAGSDGEAEALAPSGLAAGRYAVRARQAAGATWGAWCETQYVTVLPPVRRFEPAYWHINMPMTISASIITTGADSVKLHAILRRRCDLVGMKWSSKDELDHLRIGYLQSNNYVDCKLAATVVVTGLTSPESILTVTDDEGVPYYVRLANYRVSGTANSGRVELDFGSAPVYGGYDITDAGQRTSIPWDRIVEFSLSLAPPDYDKDDDTPLDAPLDVSLELRDITVTGSNAYLPRRSSAPPATALRMCDGYDDSYNMTPQRIVDALTYLGYSGQYVIYIGASHLHDLLWSEAAGSFQVNPAYPVALPVREWFADMFARLVDAGFDPVISQSYEIYAEFCPVAWQQRAAASKASAEGPYARTGWDPPSTLVSPCVPEAMGYLRDVALRMCAILRAAGGAVRYQVGEPWWWDGSYSGSGPCIYDPATRARYTSETGAEVPTPYLTTIYAAVGSHGDYLDWLAGKLGDSTLWLRDQVLAKYPAATTYILLFTPQILTPSSQIVTRMNFPISSWAYPAYDVLQLEDYDWIIEGDWSNHARTLDAGTGALGYPLSRIQYFGGFNLLASTAATIWPRIKTAIDGAFTWGIAEVCVWARPQVFRDGWLYPAGRLAPALGLSPDPGPAYEPPVFPTDLRTVKNSFGDIRMSFNPMGATAGKTYKVEVMNTAGTAVVRTYTFTAPQTVGGRVVVDYPIEWSSADFDFPPTFLVWRITGDFGLPVGTVELAIPLDNSWVKKVYLFIGQSNSLAHYTTLSGPTLGEGSAAAFRRRVAQLLGLSWSEVVPVQAAWGSAAADKWADDDPVNGVNYYWNVDTGKPGPRMLEVRAIVAALGVPITAAIDAQGENDASAMQDGAAPRKSSAARFKAAKRAIYADLREACDDPGLPIYIQTLGRGWWGDLPSPPEAGGAFYKTVRDIQVEIAAEQAATHIGTWTPGVESIAGYVQESGNVGWVHYTASVYRAAALELAEAVATPLDRIDDRPAWTLMDAPVLAASMDGFDAVVSWPAAVGATYRVVNLDVETGAVISTTPVTATTTTARWTFTAADQIARYDTAWGWLNVRVYQVTGTIQGPAATLTINQADLPGVPVAPSGFAAVIVDGYDVRVSWDATTGKVYRLRLRDLADSGAIKDTVTVTATGARAGWLYTGARQMELHDYPGGWGRVEVSEFVEGIAGPSASYDFDINALASAPVAPTGFSAAMDGFDIVLSWNGVVGASYEVMNFNTVTGTQLPSQVVTATSATGSWTWSAADQVALYGSAAGWLYVTLRRLYGTVPGPVAGPLNVGPSTLAGYPSAPTGLAATWAAAGDYDIVLSWNAVAGRTYRVVNRSVSTGAVLSTTSVTASGTTASWTFTGAAQKAAYSNAHARYVDVDVAGMWDTLPGPAATLVHDMWTPLLVEGTVPTLYSDVPRAQAFLSGGETAHETLFPRSGIAKVVKLANGTWGSAAANAVAYDYAAGVREDLSEGAATNLAQGSATQTITVTAQAYTLSFTGTGSVTLSGAYSGTLAGTGTNDKVKLTFTPTAGSLVLTVSGTIARLQVETGSIATSYIATTAGGGAVTRTTDTRAWSAAALAVVSVSAATITWRGMRASGMTHTIMRSAGSAAVGLLAASDTAAICKVPGNASSNVSIAHGGAMNIGVSWSWGPSGTTAACNGASAATASLTPSGSVSGLYFGDASGLAAGSVIRTREITVHGVAGSGAAVLAQGRVWA